MATKLKLAGIRWGDDFQTFYSTGEKLYPGVDGAVEYIVIEEDTGEEWHYFQPFSLKGMKQINKRNVWAWDGNKEFPTLTPSFKLVGAHVVHLFFTRGTINLLADSTVVLET